MLTNKYIEHLTNKPTTTSMRQKGIDKYANAQATMCAQTTMQSQKNSRESKTPNVPLQEPSSD